MSKFNVDVPPVTKEQAFELMVHHLYLAQGYWEVCDDKETLDTLRTRLHADDSGRRAMIAWVESLKGEYGE